MASSHREKPVRRSHLPPRNSENDKRRLKPEVSRERIAELLAVATYKGSPKHKRNPAMFGLEPFLGTRGDATLCDEHADFRLDDMPTIPTLIERGLKAGLVGRGRIFWTVADVGWIFEARLTNAAQFEYHGYPVRPTEPVAELVYRRFASWAATEGDEADRRAASNRASLYRIR